MQYRAPGKTGIKVSPYCLGAMMFGAVGNANHDDAIRIIHRALDAGINFIDTADAYSRGESEEIVGKALKGRRDDIVLDDLLAGVDVVLSDEILDRIDEIVPPGVDIGPLQASYNPPSVIQAGLRRRPTSSRSAA
jgi:predicted aldo/keto reductase-like oxidoreductase